MPESQPNILSIDPLTGKVAVNFALGAQTIHGMDELFAGPFFALQDPMPRGGAAAPLRLTVTPSVNAFWLTQANIGYVTKNDAAYHYIYVGVHLVPPDMDGYDQALTLGQQHSQVNLYAAYAPSAIWRLRAGTTYTASGTMSPGGGSWSYYMGPNQLNMFGVLWQQ